LLAAARRETGGRNVFSLSGFLTLCPPRRWCRDFFWSLYTYMSREGFSSNYDCASSDHETKERSFVAFFVSPEVLFFVPMRCPHEELAALSHKTASEDLFQLEA